MEEITAIAKTRKIGGSLVVTIPSNARKIGQLNENQIVEIRVKKKRVSYLGALKGIGHYKRKEDRMQDRE